MESIFKEEKWVAMMKYDVVVIGSGVGGYPAAIYLARKGYRVAVIEEHLIGGECTNYGCVPSKAFYQVAEAIRTLKKIDAEIRVDWYNLYEWIRGIVEETRNGLEDLMERYGVTVIKGKALLGREKLVKVGDNRISYEKLILALGTDPRPLPNLEFDEEKILSNRGVFKLGEKPDSLLIAGGGVIGVEIANIFANLGVKVYIVEALQHILPFIDKDLALAIKQYLLKKNVTIYENIFVNKIEINKGGIKAILSNNERIEVDKVLIAIGRMPKTSGIGLKNVFVETDQHGFIKVNERYQTSNPRIYSAGDVIGQPLLAHKALLESIAVAKNIAGEEIFKLNYTLIPLTIFSGLEIASIGYTEKELKNKNIKYRRIRLPIYFLSSVKIKNGRYSFIKILLDEESSRVYGIHIVAPNASEIISAYLPLYMGKIELEEIARTPYPHLTVSESLREIAEYILGEPIHIFLKK